MSLSTMIKNPNRGPLKLEHDLSPRDLGSYNTSTDALIRGEKRHGYKGYPVNNFANSRDPISLDTAKSFPQDTYHGVSHHLDTGKPLTVGEAKGFQYGSDETDSRTLANSQHIGRIATKTSAELFQFHKQQEEADYNIQQFKREKQRRFDSREEEKKIDMEMLKSFDPWGRPGAGAPMRKRDDQQAKKSKLDDQSMFHSDYSRTPRHAELLEEYGDFNASFGRPGNGAPLLTKSGKLKTELKGATDIRFQKNDKGKLVYDQELRYQGAGEKKYQYKQELDSQLAELKKRSQADRLDNLKQEMETLRHVDAYNNKSDVHTAIGRKITLSHDLVERRKAYQKHEKDIERASLSKADSDRDCYNPWGKGVGQPMRDTYGDIRRYRYSDGVRNEVHTQDTPRGGAADPEEGTSLEMDGTRGGGGGAPRITPSGNTNTRRVITLKRNELGDTSVREEETPGQRQGRVVGDSSEYPFGKGGGGAPLRNDKGQIVTNIYGKMRQTAAENSSLTEPAKKEAAQRYLNELRVAEREMVEQKRNRQENEHDLKTGDDGLADLMHAGLVGKPRRDPKTGLLTDQHLCTTDVTRDQTQERPMKTKDSPEYHTELQRAATERRRLHLLDNLKDKQESTQHQNSMNDFWGHPGGGAPNKSTRKSNLDDILHSPRKERNDFYNKNLGKNQIPPQNCIRNTVNSMHENMYEYLAPQKRLPKKDYKLVMPYAANPEEDF